MKINPWAGKPVESSMLINVPKLVSAYYTNTILLIHQYLNKESPSAPLGIVVLHSKVARVIPKFYTRDTDGIPVTWVKRMRESVARLTPQFSSSRAVREYTEQLYLPAASANHARTALR